MVVVGVGVVPVVVVGVAVVVESRMLVSLVLKMVLFVLVMKWR